MSNPNVVVVVLDAVSYARTGYAGALPSATPVLDRLAREGICCVNAFTPASPTQFAMPTIYTSTLPLDCGGYGLGIRDRPVTLAEVFSAAGYETAAFSCAGATASMFGYGRGFDTYASFVSPAALFVDVLRYVRRFYRKQYLAGAISAEEVAIRMQPIVEELFEAMPTMICDRIEELKQGVPASPYLHNVDFDRLRDLFGMERAWFHRDPVGYVQRLMETEKEDYAERFASVSYSRVERVPNNVLRSLWMNTDVVRGPEFEMVSGAYLADRFVEWVSRPGRANFFAVVHLLDAHEYNFLSYDAPGRDWGRLQEDAARARELEAALTGEGSEGRGYVQYDLSLAYVDRLVGQILEAVQESGDVIVAVCADHGWNHRAFEGRAFEVTAFHEENVRVPMILWGAGIRPRVEEGMCSLLDLGPSVLDAAKVTIPAEFTGQSIVDSPPNRAGVLMEHLGRGPCDFDLKPMHVAVRDGRHKVVCELPPLDGNEEEGHLVAWYDLAEDPEEARNLVLEREFPEELGWMIEWMEARVEQIKSQWTDAIDRS